MKKFAIYSIFLTLIIISTKITYACSFTQIDLILSDIPMTDPWGSLAGDVVNTSINTVKDSYNENLDLYFGYTRSEHITLFSIEQEYEEPFAMYDLKSINKGISKIESLEKEDRFLITIEDSSDCDDTNSCNETIYSFDANKYIDLSYDLFNIDTQTEIFYDDLVESNVIYTEFNYYFVSYNSTTSNLEIYDESNNYTYEIDFIYSVDFFGFYIEDNKLFIKTKHESNNITIYLVEEDFESLSNSKTTIINKGISNLDNIIYKTDITAFDRNNNKTDDTKLTFEYNYNNNLRIFKDDVIYRDYDFSSVANFTLKPNLNSSNYSNLYNKFTITNTFYSDDINYTLLTDDYNNYPSNETEFIAYLDSTLCYIDSDNFIKDEIYRKRHDLDILNNDEDKDNDVKYSFDLTFDNKLLIYNRTIDKFNSIFEYQLQSSVNIDSVTINKELEFLQFIDSSSSTAYTFIGRYIDSLPSDVNEMLQLTIDNTNYVKTDEYKNSLNQKDKTSIFVIIIISTIGLGALGFTYYKIKK